MNYQTIGVVLLAAIVLVAGACAHAAGFAAAPEPAVPAITTTAPPFVISDHGVPVEIGIEDVAAYHGSLEGEEPHACPCCACMYRALSAGIRDLWGSEIPERSDIGVESRLVSNGALHVAWYVTGTGPGMDPASAGTLALVAPDGSVLTDYLQQARNKIAKDRRYDDYRFVITRLSTGESVTLTLKKEVFPDSFLELRKKVKVQKTATDEEAEEFESRRSALREDLLQKPDDELFSVTKTTGGEAPAGEGD